MVALHGQPRSFLGINLTPSQVSLVELIDRGKRLELVAYASAEVPVQSGSAINSYDAATTKQLVAFLNQVFEQAALSSDAAVFSLFSPHIFSTVLELPDVPDQELTHAIYYKARDLVPADLNDMVITATRPNEHKHHVPWQQPEPASVVLSPASSTPAPTPTMKMATTNTRYLIHAIPLQTIIWYRELARALHLELIALEENIFPISRIHPVTNSHSTFFVHVDNDMVNLYAASSGTISLTRTIDFNSRSLHPAILTEEIERTLARHVQAGFPAPSQVYLLGRGANLSALQQLLSSSLLCPVNISQPFSGLTYPQGIEQSLTAQGPGFTVAVGLAERQMNIL